MRIKLRYVLSHLPTQRTRKGQPRSIDLAIENNWTGCFEPVAKLINLSVEWGSW
jgi:hypothetical protein